MQRLSVLVVHGSYSEVYGQEFQRLISDIRYQTSDIRHQIFGAYLECAEISLTEQIAAFIRDYELLEDLVVQILPLFLLPGVHVREDIPVAIAPLAATFPEIRFEILDYLGQDCRLAPFLEPQFLQQPTAQRILTTHGSRRTGANPEIEKLAQSLHAKTAYWATEPSLAQTIDEMSRHSPASLCIVPYFLFSGKIPAAIATQIAALAPSYPDITFHLGKPFGIEPECATAIAQILNLENQM